MIIINQNKLGQIFTENVVCLEYSGGEIIANGVDDNYYTLGIYEEERAQEVLKEIELAYGSIEILKLTNLNIVGTTREISGADLRKLLCYQMPKE